MSVLFLILSGAVALAQNRQWTVCAGDTGIAYFVSGWETSTFNWNVEGGTISRHLGDTIYVDWPDNPGSYAISVQEFTEDGCIGELKSGIVELVGPVIDLVVDKYICQGEVFEISPTGTFASYLWTDGTSSNTFSTSQEGWISLRVTDAYGCSSIDSFYLSVNSLPAVDLGKDTMLCGAQELILDGGPDGTLFKWSTGEIYRTITVYNEGDQEIWVVVEDAMGCINSDTIFISECQVESFFMEMPTAITPNGDGVNDVWELDELAVYSQAVVEIFNQWGNLVWRSEPGYSNPWDGRNLRGKLVPVDSYHFVIQLNDGSKRPVVGIVTVIR